MSAPHHVTVYRVVATEDRVCSLGFIHRVPVYYQKFLTITSRVRINPNSGGCLSYTDTVHVNPIYEDAQGRDWNVRYPVDYFGGPTYIGPDGEGWTTRKPEDGVPAHEAKKETS